jgi:hypothetical protein
MPSDTASCPCRKQRKFFESKAHARRMLSETKSCLQIRLLVPADGSASFWNPWCLHDECCLKQSMPSDTASCHCRAAQAREIDGHLNEESLLKRPIVLAKCSTDRPSWQFRRQSGKILRNFPISKLTDFRLDYNFCAANGGREGTP